MFYAERVFDFNDSLPKLEGHIPEFLAVKEAADAAASAAATAQSASS